MSDEAQARSALRSRMITLLQLLGLIELDPEHARLRDEGEQVMRRTALFEGMFVRVQLGTKIAEFPEHHV
ncbi:hypothetical protein [Marinobacter sp.]|uniref:hypothetical protein n=1 Tax=Marinobacter sp. TaxID=50741 RepID=UPI00384FC6C1